MEWGAVGVGHGVKERAIDVVANRFLLEGRPLYMADSQTYILPAYRKFADVHRTTGWLVSGDSRSKVKVDMTIRGSESKVKVSMATGMTRKHLESRTVYIYHTLVHS